MILKKTIKMAKSKMLSPNTAIISSNDLYSEGFNLSASFHINKLKGKFPYIKKGGKYVLSKGFSKNNEYYNPLQVKHINNLLYVQNEISKEIENIKKSEDYPKKVTKIKKSK